MRKTDAGAPMCAQCGRSMMFVRELSPVQAHASRRSVAQWRCAHGHQNRYAYTRWFPHRYRVQFTFSNGYHNSVPCMTLEEAHILVRKAIREPASWFGDFSTVRIWDRIAQRHLPSPKV